MTKHQVTRSYEVKVHGLYSKDGDLVMDSSELFDYCENNNWSFAGLIGAATRFADIGDNDVELYLVEWQTAKDGKTALDWTVSTDVGILGDDKVLGGPVRVSAHEVDEEID